MCLCVQIIICETTALKSFLSTISMIEKHWFGYGVRNRYRFFEKSGGHFAKMAPTFFCPKCEFWLKIALFLDKMCHMCAHTFISNNRVQIYPKSIFIRHT